MAKRKTAEKTQEIAPAGDEIGTLAATPPKETPAAEKAAQAPEREPGDDTTTEQAAGQKKSSWATRTTIAVPLTEEAKRDHTKGEVARYVDGYDRGVGARIDSPDPDFRPSEAVKEALKEEHSNRESMRWNSKDFRKQTEGERKDGRQRNPIAERLDAEERFEEMVQRRRGELEKPSGGKTPL
jgi:hypothetical protein